MSDNNAHTLIPTNIITGFLGVGKTTAIRHLLACKPADQTWSVLVNEFGEIGIDGAMLKTPGVHVREVPGGCICCVAGLPMKIALNMLIATTKPERILVEPTGLGHPAEIINTLTGEYYDKVLDLRATITLVDPRKLADSRYTENPTFQDQLAVADVLVANKEDLASESDRLAFEQLLGSFDPPKQASYWVEQGALALEWLDLARAPHQLAHPSLHEIRDNRLKPLLDTYSKLDLPADKEFIRRENQGQGYYACGWLFQPNIQFSFNHLFGWLMGVPTLRAKAIMHTEQGIFSFNAEQGVLSVNPLPLAANELSDSRIEFIHDQPLVPETLEAALLATRI
jgi:G3E family GTPase